MRLDDLAKRVGAVVAGDAALEITGVAPIDEAAEGDLTFLANPRYRNLLATTRATAVIVGRDEPVGDRTVVRADDPYRAFIRALAIFDDRPMPVAGIHPTAVIAESAEIGEGAYVGPYAVIGDDVVLGRAARIHAHVVIYPRVRAGDRFTAHAGVVVRECVVVGDDVTLQPGAVLGGDGFGFLPAGDQPPTKIPQTGTVAIGDDVDIGANSTVDRAAVGTTRLGNGVKLDNLVMIAHGCRIGHRSLLAAQFGMAGSASLGDDVTAGGQVGVSGHIRVGAGSKLAARTAAINDVAAGQTVAGMPAVDIRLWRRYTVLLQRLPDLARRLRALEERLEKLVGGAGEQP